MRVYELEPGMLIQGDGIIVHSATVLAVHRQHPKYPTLCLVLWQVMKEEDASTYFSHDALMINQEVGDLMGDNSKNDCWLRLIHILPGDS